MNNPFRLTRAADLNDDEIGVLWVDPNNNLVRMLRPTSSLPMLVVGGRGSGKTHLMRYLSYPVQRRKFGANAMREHVAKTGYIGVHTRCMGRYTNRFAGKRVEPDKWQALFALYVELWFGQLLLGSAMEFIKDSGIFSTFDEYGAVARMCDLFDEPFQCSEKTLESFAAVLRNLQRELDAQVNRASFREPISPTHVVTPGKLTFGIPQVLQESVPALSKVMFTLFIDEYEHLYADQQKYINTLVRERENPVALKIGARPHGMKSFQTLGGGEELKEGSDYELLNLDAELRMRSSQYEEFAKQMCIARIKAELQGLPDGWTDSNAKEMFAASFRPPPIIDEVISVAMEKRQISPWLSSLESALKEHGMRNGSRILDSEISSLIESLRFSSDLLIEKTSTFLFYGAWERGEELDSCVVAIRDSANRYFKDRSADTLHARRLAHFREDMRDQMLSDLGLNTKSSSAGFICRYLGLETWIRMSDGIVRNLITILKEIYDWAIFRSESLFAVGGIGLESQVHGVRESSAWFVRDARVLETDRGQLEAGVKRIARFLQELRFSKKPPECSLCRFSVNTNSMDARSRRILEAAEMWSLLIKDGDRKNRNFGEDEPMLRINGLVAPEYYLPLSARGNIDLTQSEAIAIFGEPDETAFIRVLGERMSRCSPPFLRQGSQKREREDEPYLF